MKIEIYRHQRTVKKGQTLGTLCVINDYETIIYSCKSLELEWNENKKRESCIPAGNYKASKWNSPRFGKTIKLFGTEPRTNILIHAGNFNHETKGCILVGERFKDLDNDRVTDITNSRKTLKELLNLLPSEFTIKIYN